jgi:hypothetical protein
MSTAEIDIALFDRALDQHLRAEFGPTWRTMCHQSAKIAAKALRLLSPAMPAQLARVELAGYMAAEGAETQRRMVHIGWKDDPSPVREGEVRAHFAVVIEDGVYDPTFEQLGTRATPLDIPAPYFFSESMLSAPLGFEDFHWVTATRPTCRLCIGYKLQPAPISSASRQQLMSDAEAKPHARRVAGIYRSLAGG